MRETAAKGASLPDRVMRNLPRQRSECLAQRAPGNAGTVKIGMADKRWNAEHPVALCNLVQSINCVEIDQLLGIGDP